MWWDCSPPDWVLEVLMPASRWQGRASVMLCISRGSISPDYGWGSLDLYTQMALLMSWIHLSLHLHACCLCSSQPILPTAARVSLSPQILLIPCQGLHCTLKINPRSLLWPLRPCMIWPSWSSQPHVFLLFLPSLCSSHTGKLAGPDIPTTCQPQGLCTCRPLCLEYWSSNSHKPLYHPSFLSRLKYCLLREALPTTLP